jgi:hypothetical protein
MGAYISSLTSFRSLDKWDEALKYAQEALGKFRAAETKREGKDSDQANTLVEQAMAAMELRYEIFTTIIQCSCTIYVLLLNRCLSAGQNSS